MAFMRLLNIWLGLLYFTASLPGLLMWLMVGLSSSLAVGLRPPFLTGGLLHHLCLGEKVFCTHLSSVVGGLQIILTKGRLAGEKVSIHMHEKVHKRSGLLNFPNFIGEREGRE